MLITKKIFDKLVAQLSSFESESAYLSTMIDSLQRENREKTSSIRQITNKLETLATHFDLQIVCHHGDTIKVKPKPIECVVCLACGNYKRINAKCPACSNKE